MSEPPEPLDKRSKRSDLLTFPKDGRDRITVHFEDMRGLGFNELLNDTIIDFFMRYFAVCTAAVDIRDSIHVMSCFFFKKLTEKMNIRHLAPSARSGSLRYSLVASNYKTMRSWTRRVNLFEKQYIVIPVVDDLHWYLLVIVNPRGTVNEGPGPYEDNESTRKVGSSRPDPQSYILLMDSLVEEDTKRSCVLDIIRDYLELEFLDKKPFPGAFERTRLSAIRPANLPQQLNYVDCGLYVLKYAEHFLENPPAFEELPTLDWAQQYPSFAYGIPFSRELYRAKICNETSPERWQEFLKVEDKLRYDHHHDTLGESPADIAQKWEKDMVDRARRPRRFSEIGPDTIHLIQNQLGRHGNNIKGRRHRSMPAKIEFVERLIGLNDPARRESPI